MKTDTREKPLNEAVIEALQGAEVPMSPKKIASAVGSTPNSVSQLLLRMVASGEVVKRGRGAYILPVGNEFEVVESSIPSSEDLEESARSVYLQLIGPGGRVMMQVDLVIMTTTKPHQIALDVKEGIG